MFAVVVVTITITITIAIIIITATISTATYYPPRPAQYSNIRNQAIQWYSGCGGVFVMVVISVLPPLRAEVLLQVRVAAPHLQAGHKKPSAPQAKE